MNPVSFDIKNILVKEGYGTFGGKEGWSIFISNEPSSPDTTITIYDTPGRPPGHFYNSPVIPATHYSEAQVRVRGVTYFEAYKKIEEIFNKLNRYGRFSADGTKYENILGSSDIIFLKTDEKGRFIFTVNFLAIREVE